MATVEQGLQAQIRNIEATYGKPISEWVAIVTASGLAKHTDVVAMLKKEYGMTHGAAHRVSLVARQNATQAAKAGQGSDPVSDLYAGKKASLRQGFNALFTHRVRLSSTDGIDAQLIGWLQRAYDRA